MFLFQAQAHVVRKAAFRLCWDGSFHNPVLGRLGNNPDGSVDPAIPWVLHSSHAFSVRA